MGKSQIDIFSDFRMGSITLKNRVVMAPMTRARSPGNIANDLMATYYEQRSGAGLIIVEATAVSPNSLGYMNVPALFNDEQRRAWKSTVERVHRAGGKIILQLVHNGRAVVKSNLPKDAITVAPSAVRLPGEMFGANGKEPFDIPVAMSTGQIKGAIAEFVKAAQLARDAGFDGVEIHGANGYLIDQFLDPHANQRTDEYGGSVENKARFAIEVTRAVAAAIGKERVGIRLSPFGKFNGMSTDGKTGELFDHLISELDTLQIAYLHFIDQADFGSPLPPGFLLRARQLFKNTLIAAGGFDLKKAQTFINDGIVDLIAMGKPFIANPDLVARLEQNVPLDPPDMSTLYSGKGETGYTTYSSKT